jgi:hypothetical protein
MRPWARAAALAELQHLVVTTWQRQLLGLSRESIARRAKADGWRRWSPGVYLLPGPITPLRRLAAAILAYSRPVNVVQRLVEYQLEHQDDSLAQALSQVALRSGNAVCGSSAAWLHGLDKAPNQSWLRVRTHCGQAPRKGVRLCHGTYSGRVIWIEGLPVVDVEQALMDIVGMTDDTPKHRHHRLTRLIATADALRKTDLDALEARIATGGRFRGRAALERACLDLRGELSHSQTEAEARTIVTRVLARFGLRLEPRPHPIEHGGRIVGEADLAVVEILFDIEVDGPHHLLPAQRAKDDARDRLVRRARWHVERYSTELIDLSPKVFEARVTDTVQYLLGERP